MSTGSLLSLKFRGNIHNKLRLISPLVITWRLKRFHGFAIFSWKVFLLTSSFVFLTVTSLWQPVFSNLWNIQNPTHLNPLKMHNFLFFFCWSKVFFHYEQKISVLFLYFRWSAYCCLEGPILMHLTRKTDELYIGQHIWVCTYFCWLILIVVKKISYLVVWHISRKNICIVSIEVTSVCQKNH